MSAKPCNQASNPQCNQDSDQDFNQDCNEDFHMELESHSDQALDQDDEERQEMDSELILEIDYPTELQQKDQTGTLHSIKTLEQFNKAVQDLILCRPGQQLNFRLWTAKVEFEHVLERIQRSSTKLQDETHGVYTLKVVFNTFLSLAERGLISLGCFETSQIDSICFAIGDEFDSQHRKKKLSSSTKSIKKFVGVLKRIYSALYIAHFLLLTHLRKQVLFHRLFTKFFSEPFTTCIFSYIQRFLEFFHATLLFC